MPLWLFILILIVVFSICSAAYFIINEKAKEKEEAFDESKIRLEKMAQQLEALLYMAKDNTEVYERVKGLQNQITFASPSQNKQILIWDERIRSQIADLKIQLARAKNKGIYHACNRIITQIELFLIERQEEIE